MNRRFILFGWLITALSSWSFGLSANVDVEDAHARETFAMATTAAAYFKLVNTSDTDMRLVAVTVAESLAAEAQLHTTEMSDGMMKMRQLVDGVLVEAHGEVVFQPGGNHVMLLGLAAPLKDGMTFPLTLKFADETSQTVSVSVRKMDGKSESQHHHHHH